VKAIWVRLVLAGTAWIAGLACRAAEEPAAADSLVGFVRALEGGREGWTCAAIWGWRGTWLDGADLDRQRAPDGCGPAALAAVLKPRRDGITQGLLWSICRQPEGGTTLGRLAWAAQRFGVACRVCWALDPAALPPPALLHLRRGHFVVLQRCDPSRAWIFDPACGVVCVPRRELTTRASGAALVFEPAGARGCAPIHLEEDS